INVKYDDSLQKLAELDWNRYSQIDAAVNAAVAYYEHVFANPITFTINIGWGSLSAGQQARNSWTDAGYIDIPYSQVLTSYQNIINKSGDCRPYASPQGPDRVIDTARRRHLSVVPARGASLGAL